MADDEWLQLAGSCGWAVFMKDTRIRYNRAEPTGAGAVVFADFGGERGHDGTRCGASPVTEAVDGMDAGESREMADLEPLGLARSARCSEVASGRAAGDAGAPAVRAARRDG